MKFIARLAFVLLCTYIFFFFSNNESEIKNAIKNAEENVQTAESNSNTEIANTNTANTNDLQAEIKKSNPTASNNMYSKYEDCFTVSYNNDAGKITFRSWQCYASGWRRLATLVWEMSINNPNCKEIKVEIINKCLDQKGNIVYCSSKSNFNSTDVQEFRSYKESYYLFENCLTFNQQCGYLNAGDCICQYGLEIATE